LASSRYRTSWDVFIFSTDPRHLSEGTKPPSLGDAASVRAMISQSLPTVDWKNPAWGVLEGKGWSIEFNHQTNGVADSIMLLVRGGGDPATSIVKLCKENGWVALDSSSGELLNLDAPSSKGWRQFQAYRDQIVASAVQPTQRSNVLREHPVLFISTGLWIIVGIVYLARKR
jgi:hypothetical protein